MTSTGTATTNQVPGAVFTTSSAAGNQGYQIGYSVATAGTINSGNSFMIGAPIWDQLFLFTNQGTTAPNGFINLDQLSAIGTGTQPTLPVPVIPTYTIFTGGSSGIFGDLVGWSETAVGSHSGSVGVNDIAIGSPGWNFGQGRVYWISASNTFSRQVYNLPNTVGTTSTSTALGLFGVIVQQSVSSIANASSTTIPPAVTTTAPFLGASVSGLPLFANRNHTTDSDGIGDLIVGAPGYSLATYPLVSPYTATSRTLAGAAFVLEGAFVPFAGGGGGSSGGGGGNTGTAFVGGVGATLLGVLGPAPLGSSLIPTIASLSQYDSYQPLAQSIAYAQFRPQSGWLIRMEVFSGKLSQKSRNLQRHGFTLPGHTNSGIHTLNDRVFSRDTYHPGKVLKFTHKVPVIPRDRQHSVYAG